MAKRENKKSMKQGGTEPLLSGQHLIRISPEPGSGLRQADMGVTMKVVKMVKEVREVKEARWDW